MGVGAQLAVFGDESQSMLDRGRVDQAVGGVAGEGGWQGDGGVRYRRCKREGSDTSGEVFEPGADGDGYDDPFMLGEPGQLEPGDGRDRQLVGLAQRLDARTADPPGFGRPPVNDVAVEQDRGQASSQASPVVKRSSSSAAVIATPVRLPLSACGPVAGTRRATVRPCLVISTSSPAATSSSRERIFAFASVAVNLLDIWSL